MVSPKTKRKATKKGKGTPGRRNGRSASSSPTKKKQNKTTESATTGGMDIDAIAGANGAEAAAAAKADNENVGGKPPDVTTTSKEKDKEDDDTPKDQDVEAATNKEVTGQANVETAVMANNSGRFLLTYSEHGSAFLREPLLSDIGFLADMAPIRVPYFRGCPFQCIANTVVLPTTAVVKPKSTPTATQPSTAKKA